MYKKILVIVFSVVFIACSQPSKGPLIASPETSFNWGTINEGESVSHTFVIQNNGNADLLIKNVISTCGCTVAKPKSNIVQPGGMTEMTVTFDSKGRMGAQTRYVAVQTNDTSNEMFRFVMKGMIETPAGSEMGENPQITVENTQHDFGSVTEGDVVTHIFVIKNTGKTPLEIKDIRTSCGCTVAQIGKKTINPTESTELSINFDSKNTQGRLSRTITLVTNDPVAQYKVLTIFAEVQKRN